MSLELYSTVSLAFNNQSSLNTHLKKNCQYVGIGTQTSYKQNYYIFYAS